MTHRCIRRMATHEVEEEAILAEKCPCAPTREVSDFPGEHDDTHS